MRYSIRKSFIGRNWYVWDNAFLATMFFGSYEDCQAWIDDPFKLALKQATELNSLIEE